MKDIIIVGAGSCGKDIFELATASFSPREYRFKGFLSDNPDILAGYEINIGIVGDIDNYEIQSDDRFLLAIGDLPDRRIVAEKLKDRGAKFLTMVHPTAIVASTAKLGTGVLIYPFVTVMGGVSLGDFCMMNAYSACGHGVTAGDYTVICPYAIILGRSKVGRECFLGTHSMVGQRMEIGDNVIVSANSTAQRNAPDNSFIYGVPGNIS